MCDFALIFDCVALFLFFFMMTVLEGDASDPSLARDARAAAAAAAAVRTADGAVDSTEDAEVAAAAAEASAFGGGLAIGADALEDDEGAGGMDIDAENRKREVRAWTL